MEIFLKTAPKYIYLEFGNYKMPAAGDLKKSTPGIPYMPKNPLFATF